MNELPLISIIVPVYNVEKYLSRCIDSLLSQTYNNLEIILVNDGSTDGSANICQDYENRFSSIKVLTKKNGGLSSARNYGLKYAKGIYIGFIDSDDWVSNDMYEYLYSLIKKNDANGAQIEYELAYGDNHVFSNRKETVKVISQRDKILEYYMEQSTRTGLYSVCICLFEAAIAQNCQFREDKTSEDMDYKYNVLSHCNCFIYSNIAKYHYFQAGQSISSGVLTKKNFQLYESADVLLKLTQNEKNERIRFLGKVKQARTAFSLLSKAAFYGISDEISSDTIKQLIKENRHNLPTLLKAPLSLSRKLVAINLAISFPLTKVLVQVYKKISGGRI